MREVLLYRGRIGAVDCSISHPTFFSSEFRIEFRSYVRCTLSSFGVEFHRGHVGAVDCEISPERESFGARTSTHQNSTRNSKIRYGTPKYDAELRLGRGGALPWTRRCRRLQYQPRVREPWRAWFRGGRRQSPASNLLYLNVLSHQSEHPNPSVRTALGRPLCPHRLPTTGQNLILT